MKRVTKKLIIISILMFYILLWIKLTGTPFGYVRLYPKRIPLPKFNTDLKEPLLTLFTTFSEREPTRYIIQNNTILNWCNLQQNHGYRLAVFYSAMHAKSTLTETLNKATEIIRKLSGDNKFQCNVHSIFLTSKMMARGRPVLKRMYIEVQNRWPSSLYAFCNGDILFHGDKFDASLKTIQNYTRQQHFREFLILGGRRENTFFRSKLNKTKTLTSGNDTEILEIFGAAHTKKNYRYAMDYFICSKESFNWHRFPDFIITVPAFDSFLLVYANKIGVVTFDITESTKVVHQSGAPKVKDDTYKDARELNQFIFLNTMTNWTWAMVNFRKCLQYKSRTFEGKIYVGPSTLFKSKKCLYPKPMFLPVLDEDELKWKNLSLYYRKDLRYKG
ncbi:unnamed protein product [Owenia fusiformis]|uniref:Uncharacterized protein n=1 Tax=Owenia fusiformis TaxID=6347 RepID=A0A8S4N264_OWEFU|nr:unnamed protein product [Owenia fusiformis]